MKESNIDDNLETIGEDMPELNDKLSKKIYTNYLNETSKTVNRPLFIKRLVISVSFLSVFVLLVVVGSFAGWFTGSKRTNMKYDDAGLSDVSNEPGSIIDNAPGEGGYNNPYDVSEILHDETGYFILVEICSLNSKKISFECDKIDDIKCNDEEKVVIDKDNNLITSNEDTLENLTVTLRLKEVDSEIIKIKVITDNGENMYFRSL